MSIKPIHHMLTILIQESCKNSNQLWKTPSQHIQDADTYSTLDSKKQHLYAEIIK